MLRDGGTGTGLPQSGDRMEDRTVYAGISPDTGRPMYTTREDAPGTYTFDLAMEYAGAFNRLSAFGHQDWRVPTHRELNVLFNNRAAIGAFNVTGLRGAGFYRSSTVLLDVAEAQCFSNGSEV